jgi:energy-converting hydrogenase A subunit M
MMKTFKWVVEFEVTETWVEDGFNIDEDRAQDMLANALPHAYGYELKAKVLKAPDAKLIRKTQGYTA